MTENKSTRAERREKAKRQKQMQSIGIMILGVLIIVGGFVVVSFLQPKPNEAPDHNFTMVDGPSIGDPNALVKVDVFSSFLCIHCSNFANETEFQLLQAYAETGQIYYTYHAFNGVNDAAGLASQAAFCAGDQGKFWQMHDTIFANFSAVNYTKKELTTMADMLGLDMDAWETCVDSGKYADQIEQDVLLGRESGVTGTPSFTINGELVFEGNTSFAEFQQAIESALAEAANN